MLRNKCVAILRDHVSRRARAFSWLFIAATTLAFACASTPAHALAITTVSVNASLTTAPEGTPINLTATVSSGAGTPDGSVIFLVDLVQVGTTTLNASGQATIPVSGLSIGVHAVVVLYLGSLNFAPSTSVGLNINITLAVCTVSVNASMTSVALGANVNLTATVNGSNGTPTGLITFKAGASVLGNVTLNGSGQGSLSVATSLVGALLIEVDYAGDSNYLACISTILTINVTQGSSSVALSSSANPAALGAIVSFTATVSASGATPTGTVTFKDGAATIGTMSLSGSGQASLSTSALAVGSHAITAVYSGDGNFTGSTSAPLSEVINAGGATATTTALNMSPNPAALGAPVTLTANVAGGGGTPTGTVSFRDNGAAIGTVSLGGSGTATLVTNSLAAGSHSIVATYNGDSNFAASSSPPGMETINNGATPGANATSTALSSSANPVSFGQAVVFTAVVNSSAGTPVGAVAFLDDGRTIGTSALSGGSAILTVSSLRVGAHTITAAYAGSGSFAASTSSPLQQSIAAPPDSLKLRELQVVATRVVAQTSGDAIAGTIDAAVEEGLSDGAGQLVTPSALGLRMTSAGYGDKDSRQPRSDWVIWSDLRQTSMTPEGGASSGPSGSQVNSFAGATLRLTSDLIAGVFVGYEYFSYDVATLSGRLRGDGATGGAYVGWRFLPGLRVDAGVAQSAIGYQATAGSASGSFPGTRTLFTTGLTGTLKVAPQLELEPSARYYGLWESEAAYQDVFGTPQESRDFSVGRTSAGAKLTWRLATGDIAIAPYLGVYADTYFGKDSATVPVLAGQVMDGTSGRVTGGVAFVTAYGARLSTGAEIGGLAGNFTSVSLRVRGSLPF